jgi:hypothetical protein
MKPYAGCWSTPSTRVPTIAKPGSTGWMGLEGAEPQALVRIHDDLLAYGRLEMKIGVEPGSPKGVMPWCYRATVAARRVLRDVGAGVGLNRGSSTDAA